MGSAARASLSPGARLRDITCAMGVATTASRFLPLCSRRFWGVGLGWFWISMVANHTTMGAFQLQSKLHCHPCEFWVYILFSGLASPKMVRAREWNAKTWCLWICCILPIFFWLKYISSFADSNQQRLRSWEEIRIWRTNGWPIFSFGCWTKITLFVVLLIILISDPIPSYGRTCSFVAGVDAKHIRFGFIADEIQQATGNHSIEPTDVSRVNFPNLTTSLRNLSLREWSFFFEWKSHISHHHLGKEHSFRLWKWQVTFPTSRCCRRSFAKWTSRKGQGPSDSRDVSRKGLPRPLT